jgi:5-hmdU DNA kinase, helical domain
MTMPRQQPQQDQDAVERDGRQFLIDFPPSQVDRPTARFRTDQPSSDATTGGSRAPDVWVRLSPAKATEVYETYWRFAAERQEIFFRRLAGAPGPWTTDEILSRYKFTNAYRASDRVSQYLIRNVAYGGRRDTTEVFFRTILFKLFNRVETWERLEAAFGEVTHKRYSFEQYDAVLTRAMAEGERIYSAAYIMPSGPRNSRGSSVEPRKHRFHLRLLERMIRDEIPLRIAEFRSMREVFECLRTYPSIGDFLAYQFATDLNYTTLTDFGEGDFVVPGPGALDGIRKCFDSLGGLSEPELIRFVADHQEHEFERLGLRFRTLWGRPLQLIDCQNLFCEVDKYARVRHPTIQGESGRTRIKRRFEPSPKPLILFYPPKWGLNERIAKSPAGEAPYDGQLPVRPAK